MGETPDTAGPDKNAPVGPGDHDDTTPEDTTPDSREGLTPAAARAAARPGRIERPLPSRSSRIGGWVAVFSIMLVVFSAVGFAIIRMNDKPLTAQERLDQALYGPYTGSISERDREAETREYKDVRQRVSDVMTEVGADFGIPAFEVVMQDCKGPWAGRKRYVTTLTAQGEDETPASVNERIWARLASFDIPRPADENVSETQWYTESNGLHAAGQSATTDESMTKFTIAISTSCYAIEEAPAPAESADPTTTTTATSTAK